MIIAMAWRKRFGARPGLDGSVGPRGPYFNTKTTKTTKGASSFGVGGLNRRPRTAIHGLCA